MTTIVAYKCPSTNMVTIGADGQTTFSGNLTGGTISHKLHQLQDNVVLCHTGDTRAMHVLKASLPPSPLVDGAIKPLTYAVHISNWIKEALKADGLTYDQEGDRTGNEWLLVTPYDIFLISCDFGVSQMKDYWAIGSGAEIALGSLWSSYSMSLGGTSACKDALQAAARHDIYTSPPFTLAMPDDEGKAFKILEGY